MSSNNSFKNKVTYKLFDYKSNIYIYRERERQTDRERVGEREKGREREDLALNDPKGLICHISPSGVYIIIKKKQKKTVLWDLNFVVNKE